MSQTEFEDRYDCQIQYQYSFDGKTKRYYPIISHLRLSKQELDLSEFQSYPVITFQQAKLTDVVIKTDKIRDLNFQHSTIDGLSINVKQFGGTLGFANSTISLRSLELTSSPQIIAIVESELLGLKEPHIHGLSVHTLAILNSGLDFLDLDPLLSQIELQQLLVSDINSVVPLVFSIPLQLQALKLRNLPLHHFPRLSDAMQLNTLVIEEVEIISHSLHQLETLSILPKLTELAIVNSSINYLPDMSLNKLEELRIDQNIKIDPKMIARLKVTGVKIRLM